MAEKEPKEEVKKASKAPVKAETKGVVANNKGSATYGAKDITVLEGLEPVRLRPGMYIGSTGTTGLHHLIWEIVDNAIDEVMAGYAKNITVELLPDNKVSVRTTAAAFPVDIHPQTKKSTLETVMTVLHAGGKFGGEGYKVSGGLHGVGASVVNALSTWVKVEVERDGGMYVQEYKRGVPEYKVKKVGASKRHGTKTTFSPDPTIFSEIEFSDKVILERLRQQAYLTKGVRINFYDRRQPVPYFYGFYFEGGVLSYVKYLSQKKNRLNEDIFYVEKEAEKLDIEVAFLYVDDTRVSGDELCEQYQHAGRRHAPDRFPFRAHAHA
jgi:DNA gyrase subunit B